MELVLQHQKLNKMETYKVFIDYVEGSGEVEWNCPHILLPHPVVTSCTCYRDAYDGWGVQKLNYGCSKILIYYQN